MLHLIPMLSLATFISFPKSVSVLISMPPSLLRCIYVPLLSHYKEIALSNVITILLLPKLRTSKYVFPSPPGIRDNISLLLTHLALASMKSHFLPIFLSHGHFPLKPSNPLLFSFSFLENVLLVVF